MKSRYSQVILKFLVPVIYKTGSRIWSSVEGMMQFMMWQLAARGSSLFAYMTLNCNHYQNKTVHFFFPCGIFIGMNTLWWINNSGVLKNYLNENLLCESVCDWPINNYVLQKWCCRCCLSVAFSQLKVLLIEICGT